MTQRNGHSRLVRKTTAVGISAPLELGSSSQSAAYGRCGSSAFFGGRCSRTNRSSGVIRTTRWRVSRARPALRLHAYRRFVPRSLLERLCFFLTLLPYATERASAPGLVDAR